MGGEAAARAEVATTRFDVEAIRKDFPILATRVHGKPLVYLDNAASAQKPRAVINAIAGTYRRAYANVHRGVHTLSQRATFAYEDAREKARAFVNAPSMREIVFVRGTTEGINLVAQSYARERLGKGDRVLVTEMEHHSNIVPWQIVAGQTGAEVVAAPMDDTGTLDLDALAGLLDERVKVVAVVHISNALGTVNPVAEIATMAREVGAVTVVDGAQAAPHVPVDVEALGCDFYTLSGHKMFGPTGIGVLWGRYELLEAMPPWEGGGEMIRQVSFAGTTFAEPPAKFEAGTPNIVGAIGLGAAIDYLSAIDREAMMAHEADLVAYASERLAAIPGVRLIGTAAHKEAVVSFHVDGAHAHDVATILDTEGVAVRAGHHCAQPAMEHFGLTATARASFALYNTRGEVDVLAAAVAKAREVFA